MHQGDDSRSKIDSLHLMFGWLTVYYLFFFHLQSRSWLNSILIITTTKYQREIICYISCSKKMSCWCVNSFQFPTEKIAWAIQRKCCFSSRKSNELTHQHDIFALISHLLSIWAVASLLILVNNKFQVKTMTGNCHWKLRCHGQLAQAFNISSIFSQSEGSIESRYVV